MKSITEVKHKINNSLIAAAKILKVLVAQKFMLHL